MTNYEKMLAGVIYDPSDPENSISPYGYVLRIVIQRVEFPEVFISAKRSGGRTDGILSNIKKENQVANMVVYDQDFLTSDIEKIPDAALLATIVDGEIVYKA